MKTKILTAVMSLVLVISVNACKEKEPLRPIPKTTMPPLTPVSETHVIVPENVKDKWSAVKLIVEDKVTKKSREYTINLNSDFKIPNSNLRLYVGEFLPDFKKDGSILTSASNNPNNPAVSIRIVEDDRQIFPSLGKKWGWLFAKLPEVHPVNHPQYAIFLKEGVTKRN